MLERFQKMLQDLKDEAENEPVQFKLETIQGFFEMQDQNKMLKFNAITKNQLDTVNRIERRFQSIMEKLCVPDYQSQNT